MFWVFMKFGNIFEHCLGLSGGTGWFVSGLMCKHMRLYVFVIGNGWIYLDYLIFYGIRPLLCDIMSATRDVLRLAVLCWESRSFGAPLIHIGPGTIVLGTGAQNAAQRIGKTADSP